MLNIFRNNNKQVDLSRTFRLSGLTSGAKLELVLLSRSPSAVSVALQLPSQSSDGTSVRLVEKFASTTSIWMILRHFETPNPQQARPARNLTARGKPRFAEGDSGAGTLCHEQPVVQTMGRELSTLADLGKTLAQLGFNSGSVSLRLSFRETATPLETVMDEMKAFFREDPEPTAQAPASLEEDPVPAVSTVPLEDSNTGIDEPQSQILPSPNLIPSISNGLQQESVAISETSQTITETAPSNSSTVPSSSPPLTSPNSTIAGRPVTVFQPPSSSTPIAASRPHNPADYEPTIEHARTHQALLNKSTHNKPLPSDAEIAAKEAIQAEKLSAIRDVEIKVRLPDQSSLVSRFGSNDTGPDLYIFVQGCLAEGAEGFLLSFPGPKGRIDVPKLGKQKLIAGLGMMGKVLVNFSWESAEGRDRMKGRQVLKDEYRQIAKPIEVKEIEGTVDVDERKGGQVVEKEEKGKGKEKGSGGVPKWLKLPGKK